MVQTIYVDVLLVTNYLIDWMLLSLAGRLAGRRPRRGRQCLAAALGALGALGIFLPVSGPLVTVGLRLGVTVGMLLAAWPFAGVRALVREFCCLLLCGVFVGGALSWLGSLSQAQRFLCRNGIVYLHFSPLLLLCNVALAYGVVTVAQRLLCFGRPPAQRLQVEVTVNGRSKTLGAMVDSGNLLREPFTGWPVVVCGVDELEGLLEPELFSLLWQNAPPQQLAPWSPRFLPYDSVGGEGLLPAFLGQRLHILSQDGAQAVVEQFYLAVSPRPVGTPGCPLLLSPELLSLSGGPGSQGCHPFTVKRKVGSL